MIVEDEHGVSDFVEKALQESGYSTMTCQNGPDGLRALTSGDHDLAILDVMIPGFDGFEVLARARAHGDLTPVIMLTAKSGLGDRIRGLDGGADDYLAKPFRVAELLARVRAILRRRHIDDPIVQVADLVVDTAGRRVKRGGKVVYLSATEYALLELLAKNAGRPVSKTEILERVWDEHGYRDSNLVEVYINYLRNKLERSGASRLIHTVRGKGYQIGDPIPDDS